MKVYKEIVSRLIIMSFIILQCRRNFITDMEEYFEPGRDLTDVKDFFYHWRRIHSQDESQQTQSFLCGFYNVLCNNHNNTTIDVRNIQSINCIENIELMVSMSDFLTNKRFDVNTYLMDTNRILQNEKTNLIEEIRIKDEEIKSLNERIEENDQLKLKIVELEKEVRQNC